MADVGSAPESPLVYHFEWDRREHRRAFAQISRHALFRRWVRILLRIGLALLLLMLALAFWGAEGRRGSFLLGLAPWLLILGLWVVFLRYGNGWMSARGWAKRHPPGNRSVTCRITREGVESSSYSSEALLKWAGLHRVVETEEFVLYFYTWQCAQFLPKRVVPNVAELRRVLRIYLAAKKLELIDDPAAAV